MACYTLPAHFIFMGQSTQRLGSEQEAFSKNTELTNALKSQLKGEKKYLQEGLYLLLQGIAGLNGLSLKLSFSLNFETLNNMQLPLNASVIFGRERLYFASICAITYGVSKNGNPESSFIVFQHDFKWQDKNAKIYMAEYLDFTAESSQIARRVAFALTYLLKLHRQQHNNLYKQINGKNSIVLHSKQKYIHLIIRSFFLQYQKFKAKGGDLESITDLFANLCEFVSYKEYQQQCSERLEHPAAVKSSYIPILKGVELKALLRELLQDDDPEISQCIQILTLLRTLNGKIHVHDEDLLLLEALLPGLQLAMDNAKFACLSDAFSLKDQVETLIDQFLSEQHDDEDETLRQLIAEVADETKCESGAQNQPETSKQTSIISDNTL